MNSGGGGLEVYVHINIPSAITAAFKSIHIFIDQSKDITLSLFVYLSIYAVQTVPLIPNGKTSI